MRKLKEITPKKTKLKLLGLTRGAAKQQKTPYNNLQLLKNEMVQANPIIIAAFVFVRVYATEQQTTIHKRQATKCAVAAVSHST